MVADKSKHYFYLLAIIILLIACMHLRNSSSTFCKICKYKTTNKTETNFYLSSLSQGGGLIRT